VRCAGNYINVGIFRVRRAAPAFGVAQFATPTDRFIMSY